MAKFGHPEVIKELKPSNVPLFPGIKDALLQFIQKLMMCIFLAELHVFHRVL